MKKVITYLITKFLPGHQLELTSYINGIKKNLEQQRKTIYALENADALPKKFKTAVEQINELTPKARASFMYTLAMELKDEDEVIETLHKYTHLRLKQKSL